LRWNGWRLEVLELVHGNDVCAVDSVLVFACRFDINAHARLRSRSFPHIGFIAGV